MYGVDVVENETFSITVDDINELAKLEPYPTSNVFRKETMYLLKPATKHAFISLNNTLVWLENSASQDLH